ncbi:MAG: hypothetical protein HKN16_01015 [Saprospiraceae bacterium]|nr:hypothetical protein [Saprospiraceae bacterium]
MSQPKIPVLLRLIYLLLKGIVLFVVRVFYGKVHILNRERLKLKGPAIIISNHPSTMLDPLNVACRANRFVHFLANASLFESRFTNWFFNTFYCIPVARQKDKTKRKINNQESFQRAYSFLKEGGCLYIAAEGISTQEHDLKPLRTGTARIALGTEERNDFSLGLQIIPVGIYYEDAQRFRARQILEVGEPILLKEYENENNKDHRRTVSLLTGVLNSQLAERMVITEGVKQDQQFRLLEEILAQEYPLNAGAHLKRSKKLAAWLRKGPSEFFQTKINALEDFLSESSIKIEALGSFTQFGLKQLLGLMLTPLGIIFNLAPTLIVWLVKRALKLYDGYTSSVYVLAGLIFFPIFYRINNVVLSRWIDVGYWWPLTWLAYLILGIISWYGLRNLISQWNRGRFRARLRASKEAREALANYLLLKEEIQNL